MKTFPSVPRPCCRRFDQGSVAVSSTSLSWTRAQVSRYMLYPRQLRAGSFPTTMLLLAICILRPALALVIEEPFQASFDHVAAAFGPDALLADPPVQSRSLVKARPRDGCTPLSHAIDEGGIALVERGTCNFTQKVWHAQEAGASAVVVTDTRPLDNWYMVMYGDHENTEGIDIPAVLVSRATGERLWNKRSWLASGKLRASINATGHIVMRASQIGTLETLGIYILLSVLLLAFSGICGLVFALTYTWYQRSHRTRAMRKLKSFTFHSRDQQGDRTAGGSGAAGPESNGGVSSSVGKAARGGEGGAMQDDNDMRADDDTCAICLDAYEDGERLTGLPCKHSFHSHCIRPWLSGKSGLCPMCKREAFSRGVLRWATPPQLEAAFAELAELCTDNLAVLGLFFVASVACGIVAAKLSLHT